jgi:hypothetical protein
LVAVTAFLGIPAAEVLPRYDGDAPRPDGRVRVGE